MRAAIILLALLSLLALPKSRALGDEFLSRAQALDSYLDQGVSGGAWSHDGAEGFYRAVVYGAGIEHQRHWLYLQWLEIDHGTQKFHLVHTEPVKEINALAGHYVLRLDVTFPAVNVMRITFQATESHTMEVRNGVVSAGSARQYSFKWVKK